MEITQNKLEKVIIYSKQVLDATTFPQTVPVSPNPLALSKWYKDEITFSNMKIDQIESDCHIQCSCQKGCAYCCNQLIVVSSSELLAIKPIISSLDSDALADMNTYVAYICSVLTENEITISSPMKTNSVASEKELQDKYFNLHLKCPLLNGKNECIIYNTRPSLCWSYRCYEDPSSCQASYDVPLSIKYDDWESAVTMRLYSARKPSKAGLMILPFALKELLEEIL